MLLDTLINHARAKAMGRVFLGTLAQMKAAHRFYEKNGFRRIGQEHLPPEFPRMEVDNWFYLRDLHDRAPQETRTRPTTG